VKFATFTHGGAERWGAVEGDEIRIINAWADLRGALAEASLAEIIGAGSRARATVKLVDVALLAPIPRPEKVLAIGRNYCSRAADAPEPPAYPAVFARFPDAQVGSGQPIVRPVASDQFDYEAELAVIIGRGGRHIRAEEALDHVAGYACFSDNSVRDFQRHTTQAIPGKNFDSSGGFGPWLTSADEVGDPAELEVVGRLNGEEVQRASVSELNYSVPRLIAYLSSFATLKPGDVIATGTPAGVGMRRTPPLYMRAGDVFEVEIARVGVLRNHVVDEASE
jgi:2-keto-4-pentenoate hydratase/2-oxohepta-3-ene-1,7-dioic acid hydratase in catechol pathway